MRTAPLPPQRRTVGRLITALSLAVAAFVGIGAGDQVEAVGDSDWLGIVNLYRAASGLAPVGSNATWSAEAAAHSCYMLQNGISHDEIPGRPGYTAGGDVAGNSGNVAVSSSITATARNHIDLWMTGPFHAIGILRANLVTSAFGLCAQDNTPTPWHSAGTLDVIRGLDMSRPRPTGPVLFPGDGSTVPLNSFITEYPNPMDLCGWSGNAGLPLIAMMPGTVSSANSTLTGPSGPIETCTLHAGNTGANPTAKAILGGDNAIVIMPRTVLADGTYTVKVNSTGGNVTWSFTVDHDGPILAPAPPEPDTTAPTGAQTEFEPVAPFRKVDSRSGTGTLRLRAGKVTTIGIAGADVTAISANFTAVNPTGPGYITAYHCTTSVPTVSTLNYQPGRTVGNQAVVPLQSGKLCLYSNRDTDIVIDINGYYRSSGPGSGFVPVGPIRLLDTRPGTALLAGAPRTLQVAGTSTAVPAGTDAVALNLTAISPTARGWVKAYPCDSPDSGPTSSLNYSAGDVRGNSVVVPLSGSGSICLLSSQDTDVTVDLTGTFQLGSGLDFLPLQPIRLVDTRELWEYLNPFTNGSKVDAKDTIRIDVAGVRGVPNDAKAVSVNITAVGADARTFVTAFPCGNRPSTSSLNAAAGQSTGNGTMVRLTTDGDLCVYTNQRAHLVVDINGVWR